MDISGVWIPIITPFIDGRIDLESYQILIDLYIDKGIKGIIPMGTTGESPTIKDHEFEEMIDKTLEYVNNRIPVVIGIGGNDTMRVVQKIKAAQNYLIQGILSVAPYYNCPDQRGIYQHFKHISEATDLNIIIYNIPHRTGRNVENSTIRKLSLLDNIVGLKDSCGDIKQSMELLLDCPDNFKILTGEDILYYLTLTLGGHGGILASAHIETDSFVKIYELVQNNDYSKARDLWKNLIGVIPLLFKEPNPAPIKFILKNMGLISSLETRLPIMEITEELKLELECYN